MKFYRKIAEVGISQGQNYQLKRSILITNYISLILSGCFFLFYLFRSFTSPQSNFFLILLGVLIHLLPLLLNGLKFVTISRIAVCYGPVIFLWYTYVIAFSINIHVETNLYDSLRIYLLVMGVTPFLIFGKENWLGLVTGILPTAISLLFFEQILLLFDQGYLQKGIIENGYELMNTRTFIAYIILSSACFTFQSIISHKDKSSQRLISLLNQRSIRINVQNEILKKNEKQLEDINKLLENKVSERTIEITRKNSILMAKNKQLADYSYFNSHQLRSPVANLLGLAQLFKYENATNQDKEVIVDLMLDSTHKLDSVISEINILLEKSVELS